MISDYPTEAEYQAYAVKISEEMKPEKRPLTQEEREEIQAHIASLRLTDMDRNYARWEDEEIKLLKKWRSQRVGYDEIAKRLKRSRNAVATGVRFLHIKRPIHGKKLV